MFSGIVEETGRIGAIERAGDIVTWTVEARRVLRGVSINDSIAVDGVCLTVIAKDGNCLKFDLVSETLKKSTLGQKAKRDSVNLERSVGLNDRLNGHLVLGHVDCTGKIVSIEKLDESRVIGFNVPSEYASLIVQRGSVAIDGISLTVAECSGNQFRVAMIPHTLELTTMGEHKVGDFVNVEFDVIGKYVAKVLENWKGVVL